MMQGKGLSRNEIIILLLIIVFLMGILMLGLRKVKSTDQQLVCGVNLKGLGIAMIVYANDYDKYYPQLPGNGPWSKELGFAYDLQKPDFKPGGEQSNIDRTITASWYLLVREADISPKSFICPAADQKEFDGLNPQNRDINDLWDFGSQPHKHVSYAMHNPYGSYPAYSKLPGTFAIVADMNPWFINGDILPPGENGQTPQIIKLDNDSSLKTGNSINHLKYHHGKGQNVVYADGHTSWETRPDVGLRNDNIYTYWRIKTDEKPNELDQRVGQPPTGRSPENDAKDKDDSFLAI
jgi:prepilin-type processing-associated H-X9-DG protein